MEAVFERRLRLGGVFSGVRRVLPREMQGFHFGGGGGWGGTED